MKEKESDFVEDCWMLPRAPCLGDSDDEKNDFHGFFADGSETDISENEK